MDRWLVFVICFCLCLVVHSENQRPKCSLKAQFSTTIHHCNEYTTLRRCVYDTWQTVTSVKVSGSLDPAGIVCDHPIKARQIAREFSRAAHGESKATDRYRNGRYTTIQCQGHKWSMGKCVGRMELVVDSTPCRCSHSAFDMRACIFGNGNRYFGGIGKTCHAPKQQLEMVFDTKVKWKRVEEPIKCGAHVSGSTLSSLHNFEYTFVLEYDAMVTIDTCGSNFDTLLIVKDADTGRIRYEVDNPDPPKCGKRAILRKSLKAGAYIVGIKGSGHQMGKFDLKISCELDCTGSGYDYRGSSAAGCSPWSYEDRKHFHSKDLRGAKCRFPDGSEQLQNPKDQSSLSQPWCPSENDPSKPHLCKINCGPAILCPAIGTIRNGSTADSHCKNTQNGQSCEVQCNPGYEVKNGKRAICKKGKWDYLPKCLKMGKYCFQDLHSLKTTIELDAVVPIEGFGIFTCKNGYHLPEEKLNGTRKCVSGEKETGKWDPHAPSCDPIEGYCVPKHSDGTIEVSAKTLKIGEKVTYKCKDGFEFEGEHLRMKHHLNRTCESGGKSVGSGIILKKEPMCREKERPDGIKYQSFCGNSTHIPDDVITLQSAIEERYLRVNEEQNVEMSSRRVGFIRWKIIRQNDGFQIENVDLKRFLSVNEDSTLSVIEESDESTYFQVICELNSEISLQTIGDEFLHADGNGISTSSNADASDAFIVRKIAA